MPLVVAIGVIVVLLGFLFYAIAHETGPGAPDVAIGYERAWDELNFGLLWDLSGPELRDGMRRDQFIAAKRAAYTNASRTAGSADQIEVDTFVEGNQTALVVTRVTAEGTECAQRRVARTAAPTAGRSSATRSDRRRVRATPSFPTTVSVTRCARWRACCSRAAPAGAWAPTRRGSSSTARRSRRARRDVLCRGV